MTTAPSLIAIGDKLLLISASTQKNAISTSSNAPSQASTVYNSSSLNFTSRPLFTAVPSNLIDLIGNCRSIRISVSSFPTAPVAPTIATL